MENLKLEETKYTPAISLDTNGTISMIGKSYPENTFEYYQPVMNWVEEYFGSGNTKLTVNMEITYFNSSSSKLFFDFFDLLEENNNDDLVINWIYDEENETALEAGEDFKDDFENLTINLVQK
jgi:hypothetical protein